MLVSVFAYTYLQCIRNYTLSRCTDSKIEDPLVTRDLTHMWVTSGIELIVSHMQGRDFFLS